MQVLVRLLICLALAGLVTDLRAGDSTVLRAQRILQQRGYYRGEVDGIMGSQTAAAIRRYQVAENLRVTGQLNPQTIRSLGLPLAPPPH